MQVIGLLIVLLTFTLPLKLTFAGTGRWVVTFPQRRSMYGLHLPIMLKIAQAQQEEKMIRLLPRQLMISAQNQPGRRPCMLMSKEQWHRSAATTPCCRKNLRVGGKAHRQPCQRASKSCDQQLQGAHTNLPQAVICCTIHRSLHSLEKTIVIHARIPSGRGLQLTGALNRLGVLTVLYPYTTVVCLHGFARKEKCLERGDGLQSAVS